MTKIFSFNIAVQNLNYIKFEKVDCFVNLIIVILSNQSRNPVLLAFCTSLGKTSPQLLVLPSSWIYWNSKVLKFEGDFVFQPQFKTMCSFHWRKFPKILGDLMSEQIFYRNYALGAAVKTVNRNAELTSMKNGAREKQGRLACWWCSAAELAEGISVVLPPTWDEFVFSKLYTLPNISSLKVRDIFTCCFSQTTE